jgi:quinol monooxygenase YgiN
MVPFHFLVHFEPRPGMGAAFRAELLRVAEPTRAEAGCLSYHAFESVREPAAFAVHSVWVDEAAFEAHSRMAHTVRFVAAAEELSGRPVQGLRSREIGGDAGAAAAPRA